MNTEPTTLGGEVEVPQPTAAFITGSSPVLVVVGSEGQRLSRMAGYNDRNVYILNGQAVNADYIVKPGDTLFVSSRHQNG